MLGEAQAMRGGGGYSTAGRTTEERARLIEVGRFEKRVMDYVRSTAPRELQESHDAAAEYVAWLLGHGLSPLEAVQLTNYQPVAEVDLHTVSTALDTRQQQQQQATVVEQMVPNYAQRFAREDAFATIAALQSILAHHAQAPTDGAPVAAGDGAM